MQNRQIYLFPCAGFASPQLDVPCYQFIATWKRGDGGEIKTILPTTHVGQKGALLLFRMIRVKEAELRVTGPSGRGADPNYEPLKSRPLYIVIDGE